MQLQGILVMLFILVIVPVFILLANHNIFFVVMAAILLIASIRNIQMTVSDKEQNEPEEDEDLIDELEEIADIDVRKFGIGVQVSKRLLILLFFAYCSFYLKPIAFKVMVSAIILYLLHEILEISAVFRNTRLQGSKSPDEGIASQSESVLQRTALHTEPGLQNKPGAGKLLTLSVNASAVVTILSTVYTKFFKI